MPEVHFRVRWPDGQLEQYYSPSRAIRAELTAGARYKVPDFVERVASAMAIASERVRAKFGYGCSSAADTLGRIRERAAHLSPTAAAGEVTVEHVDDPDTWD